MSNNPTTASSQAAAADSNGERAGNANGPGESPAASKPTRGELSSSHDEAFAHGISSLTSHAVQSRKGTERRKSFGEESVMSDATGFSTYTASDLTPEGRAVRAYLKQPLALRASVEAWEIDLGEIEVSGRIGEGSLGIVHKARWRNMDVAVKSMKGVGDQQSKEALQQEIEILSRNRHPNLVMFLGACTQVEPYKIVCEFMPSGSLVSYFMSKKLESGHGGKPYQPPRSQVLAWSMDLVRGLCFLHMSKPKIVHMNLKPCNLLLSSNLTLKVSDFGLSRTIKHTRSYIDAKAVSQDSSAQRFSAPELLRSKKSFDEKVDIYSVGILMWYMLMGERPFGDEAVMNLLNEANDPSINDNNATRPPIDNVKWSAYASIMTACWKHRPQDRPTSGELASLLETLKGSAGGASCVSACTVS